jgi:probable HAF family extracellular repeat protein
MTSPKFTYTIALALLTVTVLSAGGVAQERYKVVDMGTFGGPQGFFTEQVQIINDQGTVAGYLDTSNPDPHFPNFSECLNPDCLFPHAFQGSPGKVTDLGTLPAGIASETSWISNNGLIAGISYGATDPLTGTPENRAVSWKSGAIFNLGTLPGGNESAAYGVNSAGQVVGAASNETADPFSLNGWGTQTRAVLWQNGATQDLGTLGGPDAVAFNVNERGQISGCSYTDSTPNPSTGVPTLEPFIWEHNEMRSLGSLGGTSGCVTDLNNKGQGAGTSNLVGDAVYHPFFWSNGSLTDIGTFGGSSGFPNYMNDAGEVVGQANYPGDVIHRGFLWKDGLLRDLGTLDKCSTAYGINARGQIVGASGDCGPGVHAFLWENGKMKDLTKMIPPGIELVVAMGIDDRGEIAGLGRVAGDDFTGLQHVFLLIPLTDGDTQTTAGASQSSSSIAETAPLSHAKGKRKNNHIPSPGTAPTN